MIEVVQTDEFAKLLKRFKDAAARARILVRIQRLSLKENFGDAKPVGDGAFEMRIDYGPGYRSIMQGEAMSLFYSSLAETSQRSRKTSQRQRSSTRNTNDGKEDEKGNKV